MCNKCSKRHHKTICDEVISNENPNSDSMNSEAAEINIKKLCENLNTTNCNCRKFFINWQTVIFSLKLLVY